MKRLVLEQTVTERFYVTGEALDQARLLRPAERADALIALFELYDGSVYCDRLFYNDANPSVVCEIVEEEDGTESRVGPTCPICGHQWRRHDPEDGCCDAHDSEVVGVCRCGRDMAWMNARTAALSRRALEAT